MERLSVRVLGAFEVVGLDERGIGSRKARSLLKLLACSRGASVSVDRITQALWGDDLPAKPADQVSVLVSRLRSVLGGRIPRSDAGYALRYDWLDLDEMIARSEEASARLRSGRPGAARAAATAALRLVGGRPLPDEDSEWADVARAQIERVVAMTRHAGAEAALAVGAPGEAAAIASAALDLDPYDETALQFAMRALARNGRPGSALVVYTAFRNRLVDEFGVDPTSETERVHDDIVLGNDTAFPAVGDAASRRAALVGRDAELDELDARLADARRASQFVIIEGEPGIGKSALVQEWAARIAQGGRWSCSAGATRSGLGCRSSRCSMLSRPGSTVPVARSTASVRPVPVRPVTVRPVTVRSVTVRCATIGSSDRYSESEMRRARAAVPCRRRPSRNPSSGGCGFSQPCPN